MKLLLDTHIFLWFISGDARLSVSLKQVIRDSENDIYLSVVSIWEVIIKHGLGKLPLLISQALQYNLTIAAVDNAIRAYPVPVI